MSSEGERVNRINFIRKVVGMLLKGMKRENQCTRDEYEMFRLTINERYLHCTKCKEFNVLFCLGPPVPFLKGTPEGNFLMNAIQRFLPPHEGIKVSQNETKEFFTF
ncbi:hypothetical protein CEXT_207001 [Caerostris extrusa]|uniref:Uncharacterized protein n=1 Tax=Caerostris extrusa TaxID=172846 RepID=A0AAV4Q4Y0_CAEEX|nr:hypothetical protein CEXT_207001 [Caerostris extrusa]